MRVLSSPPLRAAINELAPEFEEATGCKLALRTAPVAELKRQIDFGDAFDVAILTPELIDALIKTGKIAGPRTSIARSGLGVAVRAGAPRPDVSSVDAFKLALLKAKSVMYASGSAAMPHIERMFERLGIAKELAAKRKLLPAGGYIGKAIAEQAADLGLTTIPVILETDGVDLAGPFPADVQFHVELSAGVSAEVRRAGRGEGTDQISHGRCGGRVDQGDGLGSSAKRTPRVEALFVAAGEIHRARQNRERG